MLSAMSWSLLSGYMAVYYTRLFCIFDVFQNKKDIHECMYT